MRATSMPETTDWRKKCSENVTSDRKRSRTVVGGNSLRLAQVAAAAANRPTGRSAGSWPALISQKARNSAARPTATRTGQSTPLSPATLIAAPPEARALQHAEQEVRLR